MSANKLPNLTDIPLGLEPGDNINHDITGDKANKIKSNSLKRFFRSSKSSLTTKSSDDAADAVCQPEMKNFNSLQLRFRSFRKNDDKEKAKSCTEPSSSTEVLKVKSTETRLKLQTRIAKYWTSGFKKSSKNPSTNDDAQIDDKDTPPLDDIDKFENNQSANL